MLEFLQIVCGTAGYIFNINKSFAKIRSDVRFAGGTAAGGAGEPEYRDCSVGRFAYAQIAGSGLHRAYFVHPGPAAVDYLRKMGFAASGGQLIRQFG